MENIMILPVTLLLVAALAKGDNNMGRTEAESVNGVKDDPVPYESFGSSVYDTSGVMPYGGLPLKGRSVYNYPTDPVSPVPSLPVSYSAYIASQGLSNPYTYGAYNGYNILPYTAPSTLGYGASLPNALGYGYSTVMPGYGYGDYASPYYGRYSYPSEGLGYPGYPATNLGYRYGRPGYVAGALRSAPVGRVGPPPFTAAGAPVSRFPASAAAYSAPAPIGPAPPPVYSSYTSAFRPFQAKDGSLHTYDDIHMHGQGLKAY